MRQIIIKNTKNIKQLTFDIPNDNGVYLLVGANGAGKTTLLTCLDRIHMLLLQTSHLLIIQIILTNILLLQLNT